MDCGLPVCLVLSIVCLLLTLVSVRRALRPNQGWQAAAECERVNVCGE